MKLIKTNSSQIEMTQGAVVSLIMGTIFVVVGIAVAAIELKSGQLLAAAIGVFFGVAGIVVLLGSKSTRVILQRSGQSTVTTISMLTRKQTAQTFDTSQLQSIGLDTVTSYQMGEASTTSNVSSAERVRTSVIYALLQDATQIPLATKRKGGGSSMNGISLASFGKAPLLEEAKQIADFFAVPLIVNGVQQGVAPAARPSPSQPSIPEAPVSEPTPQQQAAQAPQPIVQPPVPRDPTAPGA